MPTVRNPMNKIVTQPTSNHPDDWLCHAERVKLRNTIYKDVIAGYTWLGSTRAVSLVVFGSLVEAQDMIGRYKAIEGRRHEYVPEEIR